MDINSLRQEIIVFTHALQIDVKSGELPIDTADLIAMRDALKDCLDYVQVVIDIRLID